MIKQQRYTSEFRAEAIKLVSEQGLSQETAGRASPWRVRSQPTTFDKMAINLRE